MISLKRLEIFGRHLLVWLVGLLLGVRRREVTLGERPRILVVRLDERLGNLLLLTPLLDSLRARFALGRIDLLVNERGVGIMERHPVVDRVLAFRKRALFEGDGPLATPFRLRREKYDLVLDAANPTDPSATQALLVRLAGAKHSVGPTSAGFGRLYSAPVDVDASEPHEIDLRLQLLRPLPSGRTLRAMSAPELAAPAPGSEVAKLLAALADGSYAVLNVGARLVEKRLGAKDYAKLAETMVTESLTPLVTYGPSEAQLAREVVRLVPKAQLAPPTSVSELAALMRHARAVVSCDTGPMHLAVALNVPTCAIFVSTEPERYGHASPPHAVVDARRRAIASYRAEIGRFLARVAAA